jgi:hypothetical protein
MMIDGVEITTEPGTFARLACGDTVLLAGEFAEGDTVTCVDCGVAVTVTGTLAIDVVPIAHP